MTVFGRLARAGYLGASRAASKLRPGAASTPPWERSIVDDIAARRPWNLRVKLERAVALARVRGLRGGVTVVIVTWNTREVTADVIRAVLELSPPDVRVLVVDNGSTDGTRELLRGWPGVRSLLLRSNAGHGAALDIALCRVRTTVAVTLDSDAIPLRRGWLDPAVTPVRTGNAILAGQRSSRNFVHPVFSAVDTAVFLRRRLSFQIFVPPGVDPDTAVWGEEVWDTAELMTARLQPDDVVFVEGSENLVPGLPGGTTAGVVYHHGGVTREASGRVSDAALTEWRDACARLRDAVSAESHG